MKSFWVAVGVFFSESIVNYFNDFYIVFKTILIAVVGGFIDYMLQRRQSGEIFSFRKAFLHCFIAGFTGFLAQKLCLGFGVNPDLTGFLIGISGFAGTRMLSFFEKLSHSIMKKISDLQIEVKFGKKDEEQKNEDNQR